MQKATQEDLDQQIKKMKGYAASGQPEKCYATLKKVKKLAKNLGQSLSDDNIKLMGTEALTNGVMRQIKFAQLFASKGNALDFEIRIAKAENYADRLETTVSEIIGAKKSNEVRIAAQKFGVNVDANLGIKSGARAPIAQPA